MSKLTSIEKEQIALLVKADLKYQQLYKVNKIHIQDIADLQTEINQLKLELRVLKSKHHLLTDDLLAEKLKNRPSTVKPRLYIFPELKASTPCPNK